jgi:hypothetical protein
MTVAVLENVLAALAAEGRLLSPIHKGATKTKGRFGFRGELAVLFAEKLADEARPPELALAQFMATARDGEPAFEFFTGFLWDYARIADVAALMAPYVSPAGTYVLYANNVDFLSKYKIAIGGATYWVLPLDESTVYNEVLDLFGLEKSDLKKLDTAGKLDAIADASRGYAGGGFKEISFEQGLALAGPVKNPGEHRPV